MLTSDSAPQASPLTRLRPNLLAGLARLGAWLFPPLKLQDDGRDRLAWLALLRWLTVFGQLLCVTIAVRLEFVPLPLAPKLYGLIGALALANLWACFRLQRGSGQLLRLSPAAELLGWLLIDWCQFLLMLTLNGGINNPFYPLVFVHAVLGAALLPPALSWLILAFLGLGLYLLNPVVYVFNTHQTFVRLSALVGWLIQFGVIAAAWGIAGSLSQRLLQFRNQAEKLRERQQQLQRVHLLGALGAGVAHEFATPMNTLRLRLERLRRKADADTPADTDLEAALRALSQCENRLRQMAALPRPDDLARLEPLALEGYLQRLSEGWRQAWPDIEIAFALALPPDYRQALPELVLKKALDNLLDNAAQAMSGQGKITLAASLQHRQLWLSISDQGPGWPAAVRTHLGEPFVTTKAQGTGLGLYTVHLLTQTLGGRVELLDNPSGGACARICLPVSPA